MTWHFSSDIHRSSGSLASRRSAPTACHPSSTSLTRLLAPLPTIHLTIPHDHGPYSIRCRRTSRRLTMGVARMILISPRHVTNVSGRNQDHPLDPTKHQLISSSSRGNSPVVPNTRNPGGAQMSRCASSVRYFDGQDFGSLIVLIPLAIVSCDVFRRSLDRA
jgi:hypothetical protein